MNPQDSMLARVIFTEDDMRLVERLVNQSEMIVVPQAPADLFGVLEQAALDNAVISQITQARSRTCLAIILHYELWRTQTEIRDGNVQPKYINQSDYMNKFASKVEKITTRTMFSDLALFEKLKANDLQLDEISDAMKNPSKSAMLMDQLFEYDPEGKIIGVQGGKEVEDRLRTEIGMAEGETATPQQLARELLQLVVPDGAGVDANEFVNRVRGEWRCHAIYDPTARPPTFTVRAFKSGGQPGRESAVFVLREDMAVPPHVAEYLRKYERR